MQLIFPQLLREEQKKGGIAWLCLDLLGCSVYAYNCYFLRFFSLFIFVYGENGWDFFLFARLLSFQTLIDLQFNFHTFPWAHKTENETEKVKRICHVHGALGAF